MKARHAVPVGGAALLAVAGLGGAALAQTPGVPGDATQKAQVSLDSNVVSPGQSLSLRGAGFAPSSLMLLELCGNDARRGSADCDQGTAQNIASSASGTLSAQLLIGQPPVPCPCVVRLTGLSSPTSLTVPVTVNGVPAADPQALALQFPGVSRQLEVLDARIEDDGSWQAWFGASPRRTLALAVQNTGTVAVENPPLLIATGKGDSPTGGLDVPDLGSLQPGEKRIYRIPFELGPLAFGSYSAQGEITGFAEPVQFSTSTTSYPWALIIIPAAVAAQWLLLRLRNRLRTHLNAPVPALAAGAVIDLNDAAPDLADTITTVLTETLLALELELQERGLGPEYLPQLAPVVAGGVAADVGQQLDLDEPARASLEHHLRVGLDEAFAAKAGSGFDRSPVGAAAT